jgi:acetyl-CoA C-acetyltransferase
MSELKDVVIIDAVRTAIGSFNGSLKNIAAPKLGSIVIKALLDRNNIDSKCIDEVIMGNVLPANEGQAPARQAAIGAGLPDSVTCMTINKVCGSGLKAVMLASQAIMTGDADVVIAGGMENMSQVPYYLEQARFGMKMGNKTIVDGMVKDGLWDVYNDYHMGNAAELCAKECDISREEQDSFAEMSYRRAQKASAEGIFKDEIVAVNIPQRKGDDIVFDIDEEPQKVRFEKIAKLRAAFEKGGTVTAANSSSINDGAAAVLVMSKEKAEALNLLPMVKVVAQASAAKEPKYFTTAPADAINSALKKAKLSIDDIDIFEINEAFSVVSIINNRLLGLSSDKVNVNGGAVALGHPIGASGARILTTLISEMRRKELKRGIASLCIGGGEASTLIVERV